MLFDTKKFSMAALLMLLALPAQAEVGRDAWVDSMSTALPTAFCQSQQYFMQCFKVSQQECVDSATAATRVCLEKNRSKMPAVFTREDGRQWGGVVGGCAGEAYEISLINRRIDSDRCNDPKNWI
jgi:hypothetical protein